MKHKLRLTATSILLCVTLALSACTQSRLRQFQNNSLIVLASAKGVNATLIDLINQGKIKGDFAKFIQTKLPAGIDLISQLNTQIQAITSWPPANKQQIIDFVVTVIKFIEDAQAEGLLKFGNNNVTTSVTSALAVIVGVLTVVKSTLDGSVAAPAALQQLKGASGELKRIDGELKQIAVG